MALVILTAVEDSEDLDGEMFFVNLEIEDRLPFSNLAQVRSEVAPQSSLIRRE